MGQITIFFFGVGGFGGLTLRSLIDSGVQVVGVCTRSDESSWLSLKNQWKLRIKRLFNVPDFERIIGDPYAGIPTPYKVSRKFDVPLYGHRDVRSTKFRAVVRQARPDLIISAGFPSLIPPAILGSAKLAALNFHPGLLPKRAGATPSRSVILNGDSESGLTVHHMTEHFDSGDNVFVSKVGVSPTDTFGDVERKVASHIDEAVASILSAAYEDKERLSQKTKRKNRVPLNPKVNAELTRFDWSEPAEIISRKIRSIQPRAVIPTKIDGHAVGIWDHELCPLDGSPSHIVQIRNGYPIVATGRGSILIKSVYDGVRVRKAGNIRWATSS